MRPVPGRLTVVYDEACALCLRCRYWLEWQPRYVEMEFLGAGSPEARARYGGLPWLGSELVVVDDAGGTWVGPAAFLTCLWATRQWRQWSYRISGPMLAPLAERFFHVVSARRSGLSAVLPPGRGQDGRCRHRRAVV